MRGSASITAPPDAAGRALAVGCQLLLFGDWHFPPRMPALSLAALVMHRELGVLCLCARGDEEEELANAAKEFTPKI